MRGAVEAAVAGFASKCSQSLDFEEEMCYNDIIEAERGGRLYMHRVYMRISILLFVMTVLRRF